MSASQSQLIFVVIDWSAKAEYANGCKSLKEAGPLSPRQFFLYTACTHSVRPKVDHLWLSNPRLQAQLIKVEMKTS
jgi:hypothetical protein